MIFYKPESTDEVPSMRVYDVKIYEVVDVKGVKTRHVSGKRVVQLDEYVSSPIQSYDKETKTFTTRSGRKVTISGEYLPENWVNQTPTFMHWCMYNRIVGTKDVTKEYE